MKLACFLILCCLTIGASEVEKSALQISRECTYSKKYFSDRSFQFALAILNYTVGHVSAPHYGYLTDIGQPTGSDVEDILGRQAGICGSAQLVYLAIASKCNIKARPVYIWYPHPNGSGTVAGHAVVEVFYEGKWRYFDPTWGTFYRIPGSAQQDVLGLVEVLKLDAKTRCESEVSDNSLLWRQAADTLDPSYGSGMCWMDFPKLTVQVDSYIGPIIYTRG